MLGFHQDPSLLSPCISASSSAYGYLPGHDLVVSRFSTSPRDGSQEMGDSVPVVPVVATIDLNAETQRKLPRVLSPSNFPDATSLMKCRPRRPTSWGYYDDYMA